MRFCRWMDPRYINNCTSTNLQYLLAGWMHCHLLFALPIDLLNTLSVFSILPVWAMIWEVYS